MTAATEYPITIKSITVGTTFKGNERNIEILASANIDLGIETVAVLDITDLRSTEQFINTMHSHCYDEMINQYPDCSDEISVYLNDTPINTAEMVMHAHDEYVALSIASTAPFSKANRYQHGLIDGFVEEWLRQDEIECIAAADDDGQCASVYVDKYRAILESFGEAAIRKATFEVLLDERSEELPVNECLQHVVGYQVMNFLRQQRAGL